MRRTGTPSGRRLTSRQSKDVFAIQQEIAGAIANALKLQLSVLRGPALARRYTANLDAYNLYLKGRYQWNRYSDEGLKNAVEEFQQAIDADPGYAPRTRCCRRCTR